MTSPNASNCNCALGGPQVPHHFSLSTGEFIWSQSHLEIAGRGLDFDWGMYYRSRPDAGQMSWRHSYQIRAEQKKDAVDVWTPKGERHSYRASGKGVYAAAGQFAEGTIGRGAFTVRYPDGGRWVFRPFSGDPDSGCIDRIEDGNGNALSFKYDGKGLLNQIMDTLGRTIKIAHDAKGRLATVTDFSGRQIQYRYLKENQLQSIRFPEVTGTPTANNFPKGALLAFKYDSNGLLSGVSDRKEKGALTVEYGAANQVGPRVVLIRRGTDPATKIDYASGAEGMTVTVNDPEGNVQDYLLDEWGKCVRMRIYSGRADRNKPTTSQANRPGKPLRKGEPAFYETRYTYSKTHDVLLRTDLPSGGAIVNEFEFEKNPNASPIERGNLRTIRIKPGKAGADKKEIKRTFEYLPGFGCSCGEAFVTRETDKRGFDTVREFDKKGNLIREVDRGGFAMSFRRNTSGDIVERIHELGDPARWRTDKLTYSSLNGQLQSESLDANGLNLTTKFAHDDLGRSTLVRDPAGHEHMHVWNAWDRLIRRILPDKSTEDILIDGANRKVARVIHEAGVKMREDFQYDASGRLSNISEWVDSKRKMTRALRYDGNGRETEVLHGAAQAVRSEFDTRGLPMRRIKGNLDSGISETHFEYNEQGVLVSVARGKESEQSTFRTYYDGFGRLKSMQFPDGSETRVSCDADGNIVRSEKYATGIKEPIETVTQAYDAMGRLVRRTTRRMGMAAATTESWEYDPKGRLIGSHEDGVIRILKYDSLDRCVWRSQNGVVTEMTYDPNSNVLSESTIPVPGAKPLITKYTLDNRGRTIRVDGPGGWFWEGQLGHRDRPVAVATPGMDTRLHYDAIGRLTRIAWENLDEKPVEVGLAWDEASRIVGLTDPAGNRTRFGFDQANHPRATVAPDGKATERTYDSRGNCIGWKDANGTVVTNTYDLMDRLVRRVITPGSGVAKDTLTEVYSYDAFGRLAVAKNDSHLIRREFDTKTAGVKERQDDRIVASTLDKQGRPEKTTYPSGYQLTFKHTSGTIRVSDATGLALELAGGRIRYSKVGLVSEAVANGMGLPAKLTVSNATGTILQRKCTWDEAGKVKEIESQDHRGSKIRTYGLDSTGRLIHSQSTGSQVITYAFDPAGNRRSVVASGKTGKYSMVANDRIMNRYTKTPQDQRAYDSNGNLISLSGKAGECTMKYDYKNRMVEHRAVDGTVTRYTYDCLDRRMTKTVVKGQVTNAFTFAYQGSDLIEIRNETSKQVQSILRMGGTMFGVSESKSQRWFVSDMMGSPIAEFDSEGQVARFFDYDDYGNVTVSEAKGQKASYDSGLPPILFAGYTYDAETGFLHTKTRYLEPGIGRFTTPDPAGTWFDPLARGNAYAYASHNPATYSDPSGLGTYRTYDCGGPWPGPRKIMVEYQGCSKARRDSINHTVCWAFRGAGQSFRGVYRRWLQELTGNQEPNAISISKLRYWFGGPDNKVSTGSKSIISGKYEAIFLAIKSDDFDIDCENDSTCNNANAYVAPGGYDVNLCPQFFTIHNDRVQASILIHELSHGYGDTDDHFYYYGYPSNQPYNSNYGTSVLMENGDTYESLSLNVYLDPP
jgi:RHS repeat-associated protein